MGEAGTDGRAGLIRIVKRSLTIAGHATSVSLEEPFWVELRRLAARENKSLAALVAEIDASRQGNLSSALRIYVLMQVKLSSGV
jgi:predicted DNA-binding ribbon-helix-helix protein